MNLFGRIKNKITRVYQYIAYSRRFGNFGINSLLYSPLQISGMKYANIGCNTIIRNNARIECIVSWDGQVFSPELEIGDNTSFEQDLHLICANHVKIGSDCVFSARVFISDLNHEYSDITKSVMRQPLVVKDIEIEDGCFVGYGVCILPGVHLGKHCVVGANTVVTKSYPDYSVIAGNPAVCIKRFDCESKEWKKTDNFGNFIN